MPTGIIPGKVRHSFKERF